MRPIFIGGTGRCGTTILRRCFRRHPSCVTFDTELRVLVAPGGLLDLVAVLVDRWDPWLGDDAVHRFIQVAELHFAKARIPTLKPAVTRVVQMVTLHRHANHRRDSAWPKMFETAPVTEDRAHAVVDAFFVTLTDGRGRLVDDTPYNVCRSKEILRWLPHARFIQIIRHPGDVLGSMDKMPWGAPNPDLNARRIRHVLRKLLDDRDARIVRLKLEDLVAEPVGVMRDLCLAFELGWVSRMEELPVEESKMHHHPLGSAAQRAYQKHLLTLARELGYD